VCVKSQIARASREAYHARIMGQALRRPAANRRVVDLFVLSLICFAFAALTAPDALARQGRKKSPRQSESDQSRAAREQLAKARADFVQATKDYKATLEKSLVYLQTDVQRKTEALAKYKELYAGGLVSRHELEEGQNALAVAQAKVEEARKHMAEADNLIAETLAEERAAEQMAKAPPLAPGGYMRTAAYVRYNGFAAWALSDAVKIKNFYFEKFGQPLPISAFGQTAVHDRLGYDHHNAMDVAVQPDSPQGLALIAYLRSAGIPFMAFRYAVPGSATGAYIQVGRPSHRIAASVTTH